MEDAQILILILLGVVTLLLIVWVCTATKLVQLSGQVDLAIATLAAQYEQRMNLIPDTLRAAREAVRAQRDYLDKMLEVRKGLHADVVPMELGALPPDYLPIAAASAAASAGRAVNESNPTLTVEAYTELQRSMKDTEKDVTAARRFYWAAVAEYNTALRSFPSSIVAAVHGYHLIPTAKITDELETKPDYFGS
jgi:LemA protein